MFCNYRAVPRIIESMKEQDSAKIIKLDSSAFVR